MVSVPAQPADSHDFTRTDTLSSTTFENGPTGQGHVELPIPRPAVNEMTTSISAEISVSQRMISATWGSLITSLLVTPLDVVRVRLQSQPKPVPIPINLSKFPAYATNFAKLPPDLGVKACCREVFFLGNNGQFCLAGDGHGHASATAADCAVEETQRKTFNSTADGIRKIARNEGITTLWRGLSPTLLMAIPANVIYFTGYDWLRYNDASPIKNYGGETTTPFISGSVARVAAAFAVSPIEMFRTRMQASSDSATGLMKEKLQGLYQMTQTQGYTSLWRGLTLTMWRDVPFSGIYWLGYEKLRNSFSDARAAGRGKIFSSDRAISGYRETQRRETHSVTFTDSFAAGALSGGFAAFITTPFDVGKTRQQVLVHAGDGTESAITAARESAKQAGKIIPEELPMLKFLYHIFKEEGTSGLFKGWGARCLKVAPACAIMISSYEVGKKFAQKTNIKKEEKNKAL